VLAGDARQGEVERRVQETGTVVLPYFGRTRVSGRRRRLPLLFARGFFGIWHLLRLVRPHHCRTASDEEAAPIGIGPLTVAFGVDAATGTGHWYAVTKQGEASDLVTD
jgi:hypothetical protein